MQTLVKAILTQAGQIIKHHTELEAMRGEQFNIFSILSLETKENATHSAFIGELLDPDGSHNMGPVFLNEFLKSIEFKKDFNTNGAELTIEYYAGHVCNQGKTGGRIDIYIMDKDGNSISIENKIYADDQTHQVERYVNYNQAKNTVYYLSLFGDEPKKKSRGSLTEGKDFFCISYENTVISWLEACQKEAVDKPVLRESIRQYITLIKKLTNQLSDKKMAENISKLISDNYLAARTIADTINLAEIKALEKLLQKIKAGILDTLDNRWEVEIDDDISKRFAGLNLRCKGGEYVWIRIEGNPLLHRSQSYFGVKEDAGGGAGYERVEKAMQAESEYFSAFEPDNGWHCYMLLPEMAFDNDTQRSKLFIEEENSQIAMSVVKKILELKDVMEKGLAKQSII